MRTIIGNKLLKTYIHAVSSFCQALIAAFAANQIKRRRKSTSAKSEVLAQTWDECFRLPYKTIVRWNGQYNFRFRDVP